MKNCTALLAGFLVVSAATIAAPPEVDPSKDLPRFPAVEPKDAVKTIQVKKGFHVDLVASEPQIQSPVAICFDENGRLFVAEMIGYSERFTEHADRIIMLEDTDGDGVYDKSTVFAEGLLWPTGLMWANGGLYVAGTPDFYFLKDTDGDGKADVKEVVYSGFAFGGSRKVHSMKDVNVQGVVNSLNWGFDNRIHVQTGPNGGTITNLAVKSQAPINLDGQMFSFEEHDRVIEPEEGGGQYGVTFDTRGRKFTCSNADHIDSFMYQGRYGIRNKLYAMPRSMVEIGADGSAAEVYRISPEEPWRVIRTKWRMAGVAGGPVEGGGRSSGYFTGATGITAYTGSAFPAEFLDNTFVGEVAFNLMHRDIITPVDVGVKADRPADEKKVEFLASKDTWFRPTQFANAPDGTLYVIDMHREIIEHPWSLPEQLKKHIDLNSGNDRGRIFRIAPDGFKIPKQPQLGKATTEELVATLDNPNKWQRDTAQRLLYERQDKSAVPALDNMLAKGSRFGRLHALHTLDGLGALTEEKVIAAMKDADWTVRAHAIELSEKFLKSGVPSDSLWTALKHAASDDSVNVRYQLAFTLGEVKNDERIKVLADVVKSDLDSSWMQAAAFSSLSEGTAEMFSVISQDKQFLANNSGQEFLRQLVELIGAGNNSKDVSTVFDFIIKDNDAAVGFSLIRSLGDGLKRAGSSLEGVDKNGSLKAIFDKAIKTANNDKSPEGVRVQAIELLGLTTYDQSGAMLLGLMSSAQPQAVQLAAISTLGKFDNENVGSELAQRVASFTPRIRSEAINVMLARPDRALALVKAVEQGKLRQMDLTTAQIRFLRSHKDKKVREAALHVLGRPVASKRQDVIDAYQSATTLKGEPAHGKQIYLERCSSCHRLGGAGNQLGPDLVTVKSTGKDKMLINILDPNREVAPQFQAYEVELKNGDSLIGLISNETANSVTVRQAYSKEDVVLRTDVKQIKNQNQSLMPEGLEAGLKPQDFADLLEYISTAEAK